MSWLPDEASPTYTQYILSDTPELFKDITYTIAGHSVLVTRIGKFNGLDGAETTVDGQKLICYMNKMVPYSSTGNTFALIYVGGFDNSALFK